MTTTARGIDPGNPVVQLCAGGMAAERRGDAAAAGQSFRAAWEASTDDYERCVAAHYVARHQPDAAASLEWNLRCLQLAQSVGDDRVDGFFPSLHLNIGRSHEDLGDLATARRHYRAAREALGVLADDGYGDLVRDAVRRGLIRTAQTEGIE